MSIRTLKDRLNSYGLKRCNIIYDETMVRERVSDLLDSPDCVGGYHSIWYTLKLEGTQVPRDFVERIVSELDPLKNNMLMDMTSSNHMAFLSMGQFMAGVER